MKPNFSIRSFLLLALLVLSQLQIRAQWLTQSFNLKSGWNAVYVNVDARYDTLDDLVGADVSNPIQEIWLWSPSPNTAQFIKDPQTPSEVNSWLTWLRSDGPSSSLIRLPGNVACLVRSTSDFTWTLKGKPVASTFDWTGSGLNFIGFPTVPSNPPTFDTFFTPAPELKFSAEIFRYVGGAITDNPKQVLDLTQTQVRRGEAFWIRSQTFNKYFGPVETVLGSSGTLDFDDTLGQQSFRLRNHTKADLTVQLAMVASETPPAGQTPIVALPPMLMRGPINLTNLTYGYSTLASPLTVTLKADGQPGSDLEVVLGLNRSAMNQAPGSLLAGVLRITDSLGYSQIDVPVSAKVNSTAGLWVGNAVVSAVNQYLTTYHTVATDIEMNTLLTNLTLLPAPDGISYAREPSSGRIIKFTGTNGTYLVKNVNTDSGSVARPYPLRLIIHNDPTAKARLLERVFIGQNTGGDQIVTTKETLLDPNALASARRISAAHLPFTTANEGWLFSGALALGTNITATATVSYDDQSSNPFLHTYHPDHDNLDALFKNTLNQGEESYGIRRLFRLQVNPPATDFDSLTSSGMQFGGQYSETITLIGRDNFSRNFDVSGAFKLNRITTTPTLTTN